ncbi:MAG: hypothetical protein EP330_28490 [Deltaproteobacteria bacterium]|nr:MAG: hypothetical protein EP330_28490 [Deltaproteobacteria bacterium]
MLPLLLVLACTSEAPEDTGSTDTHDHSNHTHTGLFPEDTGPPNNEWLWECTPEWEPGSDLVGSWDANVDPLGRLYGLHDYSGCQAIFTWRADNRVDAYLVWFRANVVEDLTGARHGAPPQATTLLSQSPDLEAADGDSIGGGLARGGMAGAFLSRAHNLLPDDPGGTAADAYVFDIELGGRSTRMRRMATETDIVPDGAATDIALSGNGEWLVLASLAKNLDASVTPTDGVQLYARRNHVDGGPFELLTLGTDAGCQDPQPSHDGRFVAFTSPATNLVAGDTNGVQDVFVLDRDPDGDGRFDRSSRSVVRVSHPPTGEADGASGAPRISADGRFVVFESEATNLVDGDTNGALDVFLHDRDPDQDGVFDENGETRIERISVSSTGAQCDGASAHPGVSDDGRWVAFESDGTASPVVDGAAGRQIFVRDRSTGTTALVTHDNAGGVALPGSREPFISPTGKTMIFVTGSTTYDAEASENDPHTGFAVNPIWAE